MATFFNNFKGYYMPAVRRRKTDLQWISEGRGRWVSQSSAKGSLWVIEVNDNGRFTPEQSSRDLIGFGSLPALTQFVAAREWVQKQEDEIVAGTRKVVA